MAKNDEMVVKGVWQGTELRKVPIDSIVADDAFNSRQTYEKIEELAEDIRANSLISPLTVCAFTKEIAKIAPAGAKGDYFLCAGFRRLRALKLIGVSEVEVKVVPADPLKIDILNGQENLSREDVSVFELGLWARRLQSRHGLTAKQLEGKLGYSKNHINFAIKVAGLPQKIVDDAALLAKMQPPVQPPARVLKVMCYNCEDLAEKQLDVWAAWMASLEGKDGGNGKGRSGGSERAPSRNELKEALAACKEWAKADPDRYEPEKLKVVKATLNWVLGMKTRGGKLVKCPISLDLPSKDEEVAEED